MQELLYEHGRMRRPKSASALERITTLQVVSQHVPEAEKGGSAASHDIHLGCLGNGPTRQPRPCGFRVNAEC